jgi:hypothetical protein
MVILAHHMIDFIVYGVKVFKILVGLLDGFTLLAFDTGQTNK